MLVTLFSNHYRPSENIVQPELYALIVSYGFG